MKKYGINIAILISLLFPLNAGAQSAKEAFMALKKLEARIQIGITHQDYVRELGEAKFPVNLYLEGPEAKNDLELALLIGTIMYHYIQSEFVFKENLRGPFRFIDKGAYSKEDKAKQKIYRDLIERYPQFNKFIEEGGAITTDLREPVDEAKDINNLKFGRVLQLDYLLPLIWKQASDDLKKAQILLSKEQGK